MSEYLTQSVYVGQGFDHTGEYRIPKSLIVPLVDRNKGETWRFTFLGREYLVPNYIAAAPDTASDYFEETVETREEVQNAFAAHASAHVSAGAFSGHMEASYESQFSHSSSYMYSFRKFSASLAYLALRENAVAEALGNDFKAACMELPVVFSPDKVEAFLEFFETYGPYYTAKVILGVSLEYYVAVSKDSQMSTKQVSATMKAEYHGLFASGGISADTKKTDEWQSYSQNRHTRIHVLGGDPEAAAALGSVDSDNPNKSSADAYYQWTRTINDAPAVVDFDLRGIWCLAAIVDRRRATAIEEAFNYLKTHYRPTLSIENTTGPYPPTIILREPIVPREKPKYGDGFQVVVVDRANPTPEGVLLNKYFTETKHELFDAMYNRIADALEPFTSHEHIVIVVGFGVDMVVPPNHRLYGLLRSMGAGDPLLKWKNEDAGGSWRLWQPAAYTFVGIPGTPPGSGVDQFAAQSVPPTVHKYISLAQEVFFYRQRNSNLYTLSAGSSSIGDSDGATRDGIS